MHDPNCAVTRWGALRSYCDCGFDRPFNPPMPIAQAITGWFGERCDEYVEGCPICEAWRQYDELNANYIPPAAVEIAKNIGEKIGAARERRRLHDLLEQVLMAGVDLAAADLINSELDTWRGLDEEDE